MPRRSATRFSSIRRRQVLAIAATAALFVVVDFADGQTYSTTPITVYAPSSGTLTLGVDSSDYITQGAIDRSSSELAGYLSNGSTQQIYYFTPQAPYPNTPSLTSLNDAAHEQDAFDPTLDEVSSSGEVLGEQGRMSTDGNNVYLGTDVFTASGGGSPTIIPIPTTVLGGTGSAAYSYTDSQSNQTAYYMQDSQDATSPYEFTSEQIGPGGVVVGQVTRFAGDAAASSGGAQSANTTLGSDGFYYNPSTKTTTAIGLSGPNYEYTPQYGGITDTSLMEEDNYVIGTAGANVAGDVIRTDSNGDFLGYDGWIYTPSNNTTTQIGLVGSAGSFSYTSDGEVNEDTEIDRTNSLGQIAGKAYFTTADGNPSAVMFLYTPSSTPGTAGTFGTSTAGTYTQLGLSSVPSGNTLGSISPQYNGPYGNIALLADNGHATGTSNRYDSSGNYQGQAAWYFNGTTNIDMSPSGPYDLAVAGGSNASTNSVTTMNNYGFAAGYATRISNTGSNAVSLGQDAYIFDANANGGAGKTFLVDTPDANSPNYTQSYVGTISKTGEAVGVYQTFSGTTASTITGTYLFVFNESSAGLSPQVLQSYPSAKSSDFYNLENFASSFFFGPDGTTLYGPNTYDNATSIVEYTLAPEPSTLGLLSVASLGLLRRRRRA